MGLAKKTFKSKQGLETKLTTACGQRYHKCISNHLNHSAQSFQRAQMTGAFKAIKSPD